MTLFTPVTIAAAFAVAAWFITKFLAKPALPNVPFLRISEKPGVPGDKDDIQAFLTDSYSALMKGYKEVRKIMSTWASEADCVQFNKNGKYFLLRTPKQVYLMVAPSHIEELRKAAPNELSHKAAGNIIFQTSHTLHPALEHDQTHFEIVVKALTPALNTQLMDLVDEAKLVFNEEIGEPKGKSFT